MVRGSPFTAMCQQLAGLARPVVADLHAHTNLSDGDYTPSQVVALARQARLQAIAITDHDTVAAVGPAQEAAAGPGLRVVPGVEWSAEFRGRELHILGLGVRLDADLVVTLADVQRRRRERFFAALDRLAANGSALPSGVADALAARVPSLGRRHLANLLVQAGLAADRRDAFQRLLKPLDPPVPSWHLTPSAEVIAGVHAAGGVASLAHPPREFAGGEFAELQSQGLDAIEAHCPSTAGERGAELVALAARLGLGVTGGSDCHGPEPTTRGVGSHGLGLRDWNALQLRLSPPSR